MAVSVKLNAFAAMKKLGVDDDLLTKLLNQKIDVKLSADGFGFKAPGSMTTHVVVATIGQLQKLSQGTLLTAEKVSLASDVINSAKDALADAAGMASNDPYADAADLLDDEAGHLGLVEPEDDSPTAELPPVEEPPPAKKKTGADTFDVAKMKTAKTVKLRDATLLYQPVDGTSSGSRYFVVGVAKDLRVAARYHGHSLSIRIEGDGLAKHASLLKTCGFSNVDPKKGYASVHLNVGADKVLAGKALGAALLGLGVDLETIAPNLNVIAQAG